MTYKPTEKELDEAMKGMECWQTMEHIKKCVSCQQEVIVKDWETALDEKFFISDFNSEDCYKEIKKYIKKALSSQLKEVLERLRKNIKDNLVVESSIVKDVLSLVEMKIDQAEAELSKLAELKPTEGEG